MPTNPARICASRSGNESLRTPNDAQGGKYQGWVKVSLVEQAAFLAPSWEGASKVPFRVRDPVMGGALEFSARLGNSCSGGFQHLQASCIAARASLYRVGLSVDYVVCVNRSLLGDLRTGRHSGVLSKQSRVLGAERPHRHVWVANLSLCNTPNRNTKRSDASNQKESDVTHA